MNLRQQIIQDKTDALADLLGISPSDAFMRLTHSLVVGQSVHSFDMNDVVDGGQDKQIDVISIIDEGERADVYIIQAKNTTSFSSNALIQLHNGLRWIFQTPRKDLDTLANRSFHDKIVEYRALQSNMGPSNIQIHVRFITNGLTGELSDEFKQELKSIRDEYDNDTFESFTVEPLGCDELITLSKVQEHQTRRVDAKLKIRYDANNPSLIKYYSQGLKGLVCTVLAQEIAKLVNDNPDGSIFDLNIRRFLGKRGSVNKDIFTTCTNLESSFEFWFLNNGITVVCDQFDPVTDPDDAHIKLKNMQIVNGCQTATTLALAQLENKLAADVRVLIRIYETQDPELIGRIVLTTNNQNKITSRDLRANEPTQVDMERGFKIYDYFYERKPRQFDNHPIDITRLFTNESVAQWYLAIVLKNPADARGRKYKVWGELHSDIFAGGSIEPYIISALLGRRISNWLRDSSYAQSDNEIARIIAKRGSFHIGRIAAYLWRKNDEWRVKQDILEQQIKDIEDPLCNLDDLFEKAMKILLKVVENDRYFYTDMDRALKSSMLDQQVNKYLYDLVL